MKKKNQNSQPGAEPQASASQSASAAVKKSPSKKSKEPKAQTPQNAARPQERPAAISIDYPVEGEIITSPTYAIRITTSAEEPVEISFQGKGWQACRESVGHWWYDWFGYDSGPCQIVARLRSSDGRAVKSETRQFTVII
jgi:hypothetical protein